MSLPKCTGSPLLVVRRAIMSFSTSSSIGHVFRNVLGAGAVVGEEDDERVVELAGLLERGEDAADALVHAVDLRRVDLHAAQRPGAELRVFLG